MRGIPYSVTTDDIFKFFGGYGIIEGSVRIGKMPDGKLTGEATVLFATNELAQKAQLSLN